jgi:hypothetical protein
MFSLHETTRKRTCRTAFFALCLAPTCATAAWIADHHLPWRDAAAARRLSDRYHLEVALTDWQDPRPSVTRLAGVTLAEPGDAAPLLKLAGVESHRRGDSLILTVNELTLAVADLPALAARLEWSLTRTAAEKIELHVNKLTLQKAATAGRGPHADQAPPVTLHRLHGVIERGQRDQPRLQLIAHLAEQPAADAKPISLVAASAAAPTSGGEAGDEEKLDAAPGQVITLHTQQNAIPVALLAPLVPGMAALNETATFTGVVTWHAPANIAGTLRGRLDGVDLAGALPKNSPHVLAGTAAVELAECRWQGEQFQCLVGTLTTTDAAANGSLLIAAPIYLGCRPGESLKPLQAAAARYTEQSRAGLEPSAEDEALLAAIHLLDHLACRFTLDAAGLAIEPHLPADSPLPADAIAASEDQTILFCRSLAEAPQLPAVAWLQFIASPPGLWIPVTPATLETARRLPSPQ